MPLHYIPHAYIGKNKEIYRCEKYIILFSFREKKTQTNKQQSQSQEQLYHTSSIQAKYLKHS